MKQLDKLQRLPHFDFLLFVAFFLISIALFCPVLNKPLASDDYQVLHRLVYRGDFFTKGFFRPVSDFTLYFSYLIGKFDPVYYNVFNILLHTASTFLLYKLCLRLTFCEQASKLIFSLACALLFLTYPFHNEAIVWGVGRASIVACFFAFLSLYVLFVDLAERWKCFLSCLFYFIGLCSYETIIPLPLIALILLYSNSKIKVSFLKLLGISYITTLLLNLILRRSVAGVIAGSYGDRIFSLESFSKFPKTMGRMFLPPSHNSTLLTVLFIFLFLALLGGVFFVYTKRGDYWKTLVALVIAFLISSTIPMMFGVSTKTIEGDRLLYFPSFFLCLLLGFIIVLLSKKNYKWIVLGMLLVYNIFFLEMNNITWRVAGNQTSEILSKVKMYKEGDGKLFLLNIPDEYHGAHIFRNGFEEALLINNIDTSDVFPLNFVNSDYFQGGNQRVEPVRTNGQWLLPPSAVIKGNNIIVKEANKNSKSYVIVPNSSILYWNGTSLILLTISD